MKTHLNLWAIALLCLPTFALAEAPPSGAFQLESYHSLGDNCPGDHVVSRLTDGGARLSIFLDNPIVGVGFGGPELEMRKICRLVYSFQIPAGWQFSLTRVEYTAYVELESTAVANIRTDYAFSGRRSFSRANGSIRGPLLGYHSKADDFPDVAGLDNNWSVCGASRPLLINTSIAVATNQQQGRGYIDLGLDDGYAFHFRVRWRRC